MGLKEDNTLPRNGQSQLSHPRWSYMEQECQGSLIQEKIHIQQNLNEGCWIFVKISFRESCDSKLSGLHAFDSIAIIHWVENSFEKRQILSSWDTNPWIIFFYPHRELIGRNKWHSVTSEISTLLEVAIGTHFHA